MTISSLAVLTIALLAVPSALRAQGIFADSARAAAPAPRQSVLVTEAPRFILRTPAETVAVQAVEYSDWYERRLTIHKWASYTTLPLFAFQYVAGQKLYEQSSDAPQWAKSGHGIAATGVAALFGVNTVTGVWNMWDARKDPAGRKWRTLHGVLMLVADGGFVATGVLAEKAEGSPDDRRLHRNVALSSIAVATVSYLIMLPPIRRE